MDFNRQEHYWFTNVLVNFITMQKKHKHMCERVITIIHTTEPIYDNDSRYSFEVIKKYNWWRCQFLIFLQRFHQFFSYSIWVYETLLTGKIQCAVYLIYYNVPAVNINVNDIFHIRWMKNSGVTNPKESLFKFYKLNLPTILRR